MAARAWITPLLSAAAFMGLWQVLGATEALGSAWPPLTDVLSTLLDAANRDLFATALWTTVREALLGYALGSTIALLFAALVTLAPALRRGVFGLAAVVNAIPVIVVGPLFLAVLPRSQSPVALAAFVVTFIVFVAATSGLEAARPGHLDVFRALGASRAGTLLRLRVPAAVPGLADGLKVAAPLALLGAILGEWFGAEAGIGPLLVSAMQNYQIELLWSAALLAAAASILLYALMTLLQRVAAERFR